MPDIQLPNIRLYYEEHGAGDPILCIHGTSSSAMVWGAAVDELSRLGRLIIYDRRGCTRSERPQPYERTSVSDHADDAAALIDALGATPAIVIGRSYGGEVATDLALRYPDRVRALVLLEGALLNLAPDARAWSDELDAVVRSTVKTAGIGAVAETFLRQVLGDGTWEGFPQSLKEMFTDNGQAIVAEFAGGPLDVGTSRLATIEHPALLVAAEDSPEPFRQVTEIMASAMPNARSVLIPGGHLISPADPAVLGFISDALAGAPSAQR
jgi:pimeloyl-ACP methyl ester carboxylesterase